MPEAGGSGAPSDQPRTVRVYVCSTNAGKLRDFSAAGRSFCGNSIEHDVGHNIVLQPLPGLNDISPPEENGASFEQNAIAKALYYSCFNSELVLADDSGLEVEALAGSPGVYSARYAGADATDADNNSLLLSNLAQVAQRNARFVCVLALARNNEILLTARGSVEGTILPAPAGSGGFGYDPLFFYPPLQRSFGELAPDEKLRVSHRGQALRRLFEQCSAVVAALALER